MPLVGPCLLRDFLRSRRFLARKTRTTFAPSRECEDVGGNDWTDARGEAVCSPTVTAADSSLDFGECVGGRTRGRIWCDQYPDRVGLTRYEGAGNAVRVRMAILGGRVSGR